MEEFELVKEKLKTMDVATSPKSTSGIVQNSKFSLKGRSRRNSLVQNSRISLSNSQRARASSSTGSGIKGIVENTMVRNPGIVRNYKFTMGMNALGKMMQST